jgi:ubiquinone/menaquinone biosynthesis C-methylase UbiE
MVPTLFGPWAAKLIQIADPQPGERVLDVGCGTGIVARQVSARLGANGTVTGLDLSPNVLAVARAAAARESVAIKWHEGVAEQLPFPENRFDLVLQHLDARARQGIVAAITADMKSPLKEVTQDEHVVIPFHATIARAWS